MRLLVVGNLGSGFDTAAKIAYSQGAKVSHCPGINEAWEFLRSGKGADLVIFDANLDIHLFIKQLTDEHINVPVVAAGNASDSKNAIAAIRAGAKEYLPLPPDEELMAAIFSAISNKKFQIIANSSSMKEVLDIADKIARSDANILITGPSGTGKEVLSNYVHLNSNRAEKAFVRVNCAAIPDNLLESELFGHEKGAFTGAVARRIGKFEESSGGTLLLDEISEMELRLQAKLLRAIQEREIDRVGGNETVKVDLRIIATSNRDLEEEVRKGRFREDLYFRLNIINLHLPRLADRREDILPLANYFIKKYSDNNNMPVKTLSEDATNIVVNHAWPGNVRELENTMHRAVLLSTSSEILAKDLHIKSTNNPAARDIEQIEKDLLANALDYCLGDTGDAANILGISIKNLKSKLEKYKLEAE